MRNLTNLLKGLGMKVSILEEHRVRVRNTRQRVNGAAEGVENEWVLQTLAFTKQIHKQHGGEQGSETKKFVLGGCHRLAWNICVAFSGNFSFIFILLRRFYL